MIRSGLDMAGYRVLEAANLDEAIRGLEQQPVDVVVAALDLPPTGTSALLRRHAERPEWASIPVLALADSAEQVQAKAGPDRGFRIASRSSTVRPCWNRSRASLRPSALPCRNP
jgi:CheY-like chemotaxis protein